MEPAGHRIASIDHLRALYGAPRERAVRKQLAALDRHCRAFVALSPFLVIATSDREGRHDASPRGGAPGFVKVDAAGDLLIPDSPGNNRLDTFQNIVATGRVGLLFLVPGIDETLRVNGAAWLSAAPDELEACRDERRTPKLVLHVRVDEAYLHCAKAFMRSRLWDASAQVKRSVLPTTGQILNDQMGVDTPPESQEAMVQRYLPDL